MKMLIPLCLLAALAVTTALAEEKDSPEPATPAPPTIDAIIPSVDEVIIPRVDPPVAPESEAPVPIADAAAAEPQEAPAEDSVPKETVTESHE